jgi:hypothetical protein
VGGRTQHVLGRPGLDHGTVLRHRHVVGDQPYGTRVVGHEHVAETELGLQVDEELEDLSLHRGVERADRLVEHKDLGVERESPGDRNPLPLASGRAMRPPVRRSSSTPRPPTSTGTWWRSRSLTPAQTRPDPAGHPDQSRLPDPARRTVGPRPQRCRRVVKVRVPSDTQLTVGQGVRPPRRQQARRDRTSAIAGARRTASCFGSALSSASAIFPSRSMMDSSSCLLSSCSLRRRGERGSPGGGHAILNLSKRPDLVCTSAAILDVECRYEDSSKALSVATSTRPGDRCRKVESDAYLCRDIPNPPLRPRTHSRGSLI